MNDIEITRVRSANINRHKPDDDHEFSRETGFPSPARDHYEKPLSLDEHLIHRPAATYFVRVKGNDLNNIGIFTDDILVVDRSIDPKNGLLLIVRLDDANVVRRLERRKASFYFCSGNACVEDVKVDNDLNYEIWGVVSYTIHKHI